MGDIILSNGTVITASELAEIAGEVKKLIAKESKEPSQYEEVNSLSGLTTLPALLQSGSSFRLVRAAVELLKGVDAKEIQLRLSETAIQWRHDGEETWQDLITVAKLQEPANTAATLANEAAQKADTATTNANEATAKANSATSAANNAAQSANSAASAANTAADRVDESILDVTTEKKLAIAAAKNANDSATGAQKSTVRANAAAEKAEEVISRAEQAVTDANNATDSATEKIGDMNTGLSRLEELEATLTAKDRLQPTAMKLTYPKKITFGNTAEQRIEATLSPAGTGKNVLFLSDNRSVQVMPDGFIRVLSVGKSFVHAIPTENTAIYQTVEIEVLPTPIRMLTSTAMRLTSSGAMRLG